MSGYWKDEEKTKKTIDKDGWVHTGDIGYVDEDGYYFLAGRSIGSAIIAMTILASLFSGISFLAAPSEGYANGPVFYLVTLGFFVATPILTLIERLRATAGATLAPEFLPPDATAGSCRAARIARAREALGWAPATSLEDGLRRTWEWHRAALPA